MSNNLSNNKNLTVSKTIKISKMCDLLRKQIFKIENNQRDSEKYAYEVRFQ